MSLLPNTRRGQSCLKYVTSLIAIAAIRLMLAHVSLSETSLDDSDQHWRTDFNSSKHILQKEQNVLNGSTNNVLNGSTNIGPPLKYPSCSMEARLDQIRANCDAYGPPASNYSEAYLVVFDHARKTLGCIVSKAASTSWVAFAVKTANTKNIKIRSAAWGSKQSKELGKLNMSRTIGVSISDLNGKYANWTKYMTARHPMQRVVSGYFEAVKKRKLYKVTFEEYISKLVSGELTDRDEHWRRLHTWCFPCQVKYDLIIKIETVEKDKIAYVNMLNSTQLPNQFTKMNVNSNKGGTGFSKYDAMLRDFGRDHPELLKQLIELHRRDMDMFGYDWSMENGSTCTRDPQTGECC